jgi:Uma2 family endonuclease
MDWTHVINDPSLADLPYKIELNEWGNIEMSPATNRHNMLQSKILLKLKELIAEGDAFVECSVLTTKNVKVADVVWGSPAFFEKNGFETPYKVAPEICVEVTSPSNSTEEMMIKKDLYLAKGAREFWICNEEGELSFFDHKGEIERSELCPDFPKNIRI